MTSVKSQIWVQVLDQVLDQAKELLPEEPNE
jgi:hypothetical protein